MSQAQNNPASNNQGDDSVYGYLVEFDTTAQLMAAARKVRDKGYSKWDAHTPFPVHGLDEAMGVKQTILPGIVFFCGLTGITVAFLMQWWMNGVDYQVIISNKPNESPWRMLPAMVPVMFELMVLFSAFGAVGTMFAMNGLPRWHHPLFHSQRFARATNDRFFIAIEAKDPKFDAAETKGFMASLGGISLESVPMNASSSELDELLKAGGLA